MNEWYGKGLILLGLVVTIWIRNPHEKRSATQGVAKSYQTPREKLLLALVAIGIMALPVLAIATPLFSFADYALHPLAFATGSIALLPNIWLFQRSHVDLGSNWSRTLELRENHELVTKGVYRYVRHPMYTAIFLYALAQALLLPNWVGGPAGLVAFTALYALRVKREEQMMTEQFGAAYLAYAKSTKRLIPGIY